MEEKKIKAYKGFNADMTCQGFQYEVGKEYELPEGQSVELCAHGFHACENPLDVLDHMRNWRTIGEWHEGYTHAELFNLKEI